MVVGSGSKAGGGDPDAGVPGSPGDSGMDPMYWLMPVGLFLGLCVVKLYERKSTGGPAKRKETFRALTKNNDNKRAESEQFLNLELIQRSFSSVSDRESSLDPVIEQKLSREINGLSNVWEFWTGGVLHLQFSPEHYNKVYEMLALLSALMLGVGVTFYTADTNVAYDYGLVCCITNCTLWMCTLSSAFFATVVHTCQSNAQVALLVGLYGTWLMRVPMMLFVWGLMMLFLEFVLFFKINVDPGFHCSACLGACLVIFPLFLHMMHKMGWVASVVHHASEVAEREAVVPTPEDIQATFHSYVASKASKSPKKSPKGNAGNVLALDREEFLALLDVPGVTSVQRAFAAELFDAHVKVQLKKLHEFFAVPTAPAVSSKEDFPSLEGTAIGAAKSIAPETEPLCSSGTDKMKL